MRYLLNGIKLPSLDPVKTQILATTALGTDFHWYVNLFKDFIKQSASTQMMLDVNVSQVDIGDEYASGRVGYVLDDRFYEPEDYITFSREKNNGICELRLKRAATGGSGGDDQVRRRDNRNARKRQKGNSHAELNRTIKALVLQISKDNGDQVPPRGNNAEQ